MASSTSINELPTGPPGNKPSSSINNITLEPSNLSQPTTVPQVAQATIQSPTPQNMPDAKKQLEMNQVISGIQQASAVGSTMLPSRDIPQDTLSLVQDNQSSPTFIPQPPPENGPRDYIAEPDHQYLHDMQHRNSVKINAMDEFYNEIQSPLLIAILYFLFQLPITRKIFKRYLPILFNSDGNQNSVGYFIISAMFGLTFYVINLFAAKLTSIV